MNWPDEQKNLRSRNVQLTIFQSSNSSSHSIVIRFLGLVWSQKHQGGKCATRIMTFLYANFYKMEWSEWTNNLAIYTHAEFIHNCLEQRKTESTGGNQNSLPNDNDSGDDDDDDDYDDEQEEEESVTVREVKKDNEFEWKKKKRHTQIVQYSYASFRLLLRRSHIELCIWIRFAYMKWNWSDKFCTPAIWNSIILDLSHKYRTRFFITICLFYTCTNLLLFTMIKNVSFCFCCCFFSLSFRWFGVGLFIYFFFSLLLLFCSYYVSRAVDNRDYFESQYARISYVSRKMSICTRRARCWHTEKESQSRIKYGNMLHYFVYTVLTVCTQFDRNIKKYGLLWHSGTHRFGFHGIPHNLHFIISCECSCFFMLFTLNRTREEKNIARGKYYNRRHIHAIVTRWICVHLFGIHYGNVNGDVQVVAQ